MGRLTLDEVRAVGWARGLELGPLTQEQAGYVAELLAPHWPLILAARESQTAN
jgi:hypothetical protein